MREISEKSGCLTEPLLRCRRGESGCEIMKKSLKISLFRALSSTLVVLIVIGQVAPPVVYAQTIDDVVDQRICERDGGTWNGTSCDMPAPPADVCPNVEGDQPSGPCADTECADTGGTWDSTSCVMPAPSPSPSPTPTTTPAPEPTPSP